jgi:hypothetical protein
LDERRLVDAELNAGAELYDAEVTGVELVVRTLAGAGAGAGG